MGNKYIERPANTRSRKVKALHANAVKKAKKKTATTVKTAAVVAINSSTQSLLSAETSKKDKVTSMPNENRNHGDDINASALVRTSHMSNDLPNITARLRIGLEKLKSQVRKNFSSNFRVDTIKEIANIVPGSAHTETWSIRDHKPFVMKEEEEKNDMEDDLIERLSVTSRNSAEAMETSDSESSTEVSSDEESNSEDNTLAQLRNIDLVRDKLKSPVQMDSFMTLDTKKPVIMKASVTDTRLVGDKLQSPIQVSSLMTFDMKESDVMEAVVTDTRRIGDKLKSPIQVDPLMTFDTKESNVMEAAVTDTELVGDKLKSPKLMHSLMTFGTKESNVMEAAVSDTRTEQAADELSILDHRPFIVKVEEKHLSAEDDIVERDVTEKIQERSVYGLCRCCLSLGRFESLDSCHQGKETRSYADLILFTFGVKISGHSTRLICSECVPKLLQALAFRRQVLASERDFLRMSSKSSISPVSLSMNKSTHETIDVNEEDNYESDSTNSTDGGASTYDFTDTDDNVPAAMETLKEVVAPENSATNSTPAIFCSDDEIQDNVTEFTEVSTPAQALLGSSGDITALTNTSPELGNYGVSATPDGIDPLKSNVDESCDLHNGTPPNRVFPEKSLQASNTTLTVLVLPPQFTVLGYPTKHIYYPTNFIPTIFCSNNEAQHKVIASTEVSTPTQALSGPLVTAATNTSELGGCSVSATSDGIDLVKSDIEESRNSDNDTLLNKVDLAKSSQTLSTTVSSLALPPKITQLGPPTKEQIYYPTNFIPTIFCPSNEIQSKVIESTEVSTPTQVLAEPLGNVTAMTNTSPKLGDCSVPPNSDVIDSVNSDIEESNDLANDTPLNRIHLAKSSQTSSTTLTSLVLPAQTTVVGHSTKHIYYPTNYTPVIFCSNNEKSTEASKPTQVLAGPLGNITSISNTSPELGDCSVSATPDGIIDLAKSDLEESCYVDTDTLLNRVHPDKSQASTAVTLLLPPQENPVKKQTETKSAKCKICKRKIQNIAEHMLVHLICRECKLILPNIHSKYEHFLPQPRTELTICKGHLRLTNTVKGNAIEFQEPESDEKLFKCVKCKAKYILKRSLEQHLRIKHLMCNVCKQTFDTILKLEEHEKEHSIDCTSDMTFENDCTQNNHICKGHKRLGKILHHCTLCYRKFTGEERRDNHIKYAHLTCHRCDQTFTTVHKRDEHVLEEHPIKCNKCGKNFGSSLMLYKHRNSVHAKCNICKIEMHRCKIDKHMIESHGAPIIQCGACSKSFKSRRTLKIHQRIVHLAERDAQCPQCDYVSFRKQGLDQHMLVHGAGVRNYICKHCGKKFIRQRNLIVHERIHTGDKRAVCKLCGEAFVQRASLKYHLEKRHPGEKY